MKKVVIKPKHVITGASSEPAKNKTALKRQIPFKCCCYSLYTHVAKENGSILKEVSVDVCSVKLQYKHNTKLHILKESP